MATLSTDNIRPASSNTISISSATLTNSAFVSVFENANVVAAAASGLINVDVLNNSIMFYTGNTSANVTINIRGNSTSSLNSVLSVGQTATAVVMLSQGPTAYLANAFSIDSTTITPRWSGGSAPTGGNANSIDVVSITVVKTAATPTYSMLSSITQFK